MNINRHNYEEWFLMYVDNELSKAQRSAVDEFIQENTDLAEELNMLQQSILKPEKHIVFAHKESLMKADQATTINESNYQEYFLLYTDNELSAPEKSAVEQFVYNHPELQEEFELWHDMKLVPEKIVFEDKEKLYRREQPAKIIPIRWWGIAAAAMVLMIAGIFWLNNQPSVSTQNHMAEKTKKNNTVEKPLKQEPALANSHPRQDAKDIDVARNKNKIKEGKTNPGPDVKTIAHNKLKPILTIEKSRDPNPNVIAANENNLHSKNINTTIPSNTVKPIDVNNSMDAPLAKSDIINRTVLVTHAGEANDNAVRTMLASNDKTENIFLTNIPVDHNPTLKGFLRKASRVIDKVTALKNGRAGVSIGNVEIALQ